MLILFSNYLKKENKKTTTLNASPLREHY